MPRTTLEISGKDNGATQAVTNVSGAVIKAGVALAGLNLVSSAMLGLAGQSITAYGQQEQAIAKLKVQVGNNTKEYEKFASQIQSSTTIGDEQVLMLQTLGLNMGVAKDKINDTTKEAIGLSEAFGIDLNSSMKMVALANQGEYTQLARYIPALRTATTETQKMAIVQEAAAKGFDMAEKAAGTLSGRLKQNANLMGDVQEELGKTILQFSEPFNKAISSVLGWFLALDDGTKNLILTIGLIAGVSVTAAVAITGIITALKMMTIVMAGNPFGLILLGVTAVVAAVISLVGWLGKTNDILKDMSKEDLTKELFKMRAAYKEIEKETGIHTKSLTTLKNTYKEYDDIIRGVNTTSNESLSNVMTKSALIKEQIEILEKLKNVEAAVGGDPVARRKVAEEMNAIAVEYENKYLDIIQTTEKKLERERDSKLEKIKKNSEAEAKIRKYYDKLIADNKIAEENRAVQAALDIGGMYYSSLSTLVQGHFAAELTMAEGNVEEQKRIKREQFTATKLLSAGEIVINTASSIAKTMSTMGYPLGIPFAIAAGVLGAAQLAVAVGQPMPAFAQGGISSGGYALVGEGGPEIVKLPAGSKVNSNSDSQKMMGGITISGTINVYAQDAKDFIRQLRSISRTEASRA